MREREFRFKRTVPVPRGHCPEPIIESYIGFGGRRSHWARVLVYETRDGAAHTITTAYCYGGWTKLRVSQEYGDKIMEDHADLRLPWRVAPLSGKYYGTHVLDAEGEEVAQFWNHDRASEPSSREKACFVAGWSEEVWAEYCCDSHWESERDYQRALKIVEAVNAAYAKEQQP